MWLKCSWTGGRAVRLLTLQFAAQLYFLLLQAADPPLIGLCGQAVLQAALDIQVQLVPARLPRLARQLPQASPVGQGTRGKGGRAEERGQEA